MSHILVSVLAEVAANCYFSMHTQFSTSPDMEDVSCTQVQEKQFCSYQNLAVIQSGDYHATNKDMLICHMSYEFI